MRSAKRAVKTLIASAGFEIRRKPRPPVSLIDFLRSREIAVVLDVGANAGQFGRRLRDIGFQGKIVSFEPTQRAYKQLCAESHGDPAWICQNVALGSQKGKSTINVSKFSLYSSLLAQTDAAAIYDQKAQNVSTEEVEVVTLDEIGQEFFREKCFLKIDTQGYEKEVLDGAKESLGNMLGVQMELPIIHLYKKVWSLGDALNYMEARDLVPCQIYPINYHLKDAQALIEIDCIFRRKDPTLGE